MKVVGLVSGGKDSCFNLMHCVANGHEIVALANLYPEDALDHDELDSFMYQTVGYRALKHYEQCIGVPLYRRQIKGKSLVVSLEYTPIAQDETEDLYSLLSTVVQNHPDITAVSVGAILSTYQRVRVENVCQRLNLTCLAYLWQRDQAELLDEIIESGIDARIIKTAGIGLNMKHLGRSLSDVRQDLIRLNSLYGLHLCGEGGEYETFVLDAPIFKKKLQFKESSGAQNGSEDVFYLKFEVELEEKEPEELRLVVPDLLEQRYGKLLENLQGLEKVNIASSLEKIELALNLTTTQQHYIIANITASNSVSTDLSQEVEAIFELLRSKLQQLGSSFSSLASISLQLKSMKDFKQVNETYSKYFSEPNPPARVCIASELGSDHRLILTARISSTETTNPGLHVQSLSYWAPANIGPYSQAIICDGILHLAGQIGLIPRSMELASDLATQAVVSLQSIMRVIEVCGGRQQLACAVVYATSLKAIAVANKVWESIDQNCRYFGVIVKALPRDASVEWTAIAIEQRYLDIDSEEFPEQLSPPNDFETWEISQCHQRFIISIVTDDKHQLITKLKSLLTRRLLLATLYTSSNIAVDFNSLPNCLELVRTEGIYHKGKQWNFGLVAVI